MLFYQLVAKPEGLKLSLSQQKRQACPKLCAQRTAAVCIHLQYDKRIIVVTAGQVRQWNRRMQPFIKSRMEAGRVVHADTVEEPLTTDKKLTLLMLLQMLSVFGSNWTDK